MMYHLGKHNQVSSENVSQPFICGECGRLFRDSKSLMSHIIIHQDRLEKLMEEIKGLKNTEFKDRGAAVSCPQRVFGCNCYQTLVQHANTHDNLRHYYFCEECNFITLTRQALEAHLRVTHLDAQQPKRREMTHSNDADRVARAHFTSEMGFYTSRDKVALDRHSGPQHRQSPHSNYKKVPSTHGETAHFPLCSRRKGEKYTQESNDQKVISRENTPSPSLWRVDRHGQLLLQPVEELHVATDLTCVEEEEDTENTVCQAFGSSKQANCPRATHFKPPARNLKLDQMFCRGDGNSGEKRSSGTQEYQNSVPVKRMSTPLRNSIDNTNGDASPRLCQRLKKEFPDREPERGREGGSNFSNDTSGATGSVLESCENERNPYARRYLRKRHRVSVKDQSPGVLKDQDNGDEDCSDIEQLIIKEEYTENTACHGSPESPSVSTSDSFDVSLKAPAVEHIRPCPYCPAMFESGVGLSNHVRGHLHRVGLSYDARHTLSPEQVAERDRRPPARRRGPSGLRRMRNALKTEGRGEHTCPLCWGWFDTKTGLSNHVRGHLKRIGGSVSSTAKSPLCILNQLLLRDEKKHGTILQVLNQSQAIPPSFVPEKSSSSGGLVLMSSGAPVETHCEARSPRRLSDSRGPRQEKEVFSKTTQLQEDEQRASEGATASTLVKLLNMKQESMELTAEKDQQAFTTSRLCELTNGYKEDTRATGVAASWATGKCDSNEIWIQCNGTLPRLHGHLQVYAHGERTGIIEGPGYNFKPKAPRPRPGLRKKGFPSLNAEIYTLTCRFCDLVFHGPSSVQEDWIRHLQRHLLHTSVSCSGTGMVEVLGLHHNVQISMFGERPGLE